MLKTCILQMKLELEADSEKPQKNLPPGMRKHTSAPLFEAALSMCLACFAHCLALF